MKKVLFLLTVAAMVLALCLTLSACGEETPATTTAAVTTAPETTPTAIPNETTPVMTTAIAVPVITTPVTTVPATTPVTTTPDTTPVELGPTSISYSMSMGGYLYTQFDEADRTSVRYVYDRDTMQKTDKMYTYRYDESGKLNGFSMADADGVTVYTLSLSDDGKTVTATDAKDPAFTYSILLDENGKILSETTLHDGEAAFRFDFDENGFVVMETMYFRGMAIEYETVYDSGFAFITCELANAATELCVTYNDYGYPISLEGTQLSTEYWYVYTYNRKMLCATANFMDEGYEFYFEFTYDDKDRLIKVYEENDEGINEEEYTYNDKDLVIRHAVTNKTYDEILNYFYVTTYSYDDMGRRIKTVSYENGDEETHTTKWTYCYTYNEDGSLAEDTADFTTSDDGFIASFKDTYEYDSFGRQIRDTMIEYDEKGNVLNKTVFESEYDEDGELVKEIVSRYDAKGDLVSQDVTDYTK